MHTFASSVVESWEVRLFNQERCGKEAGNEFNAAIYMKAAAETRTMIEDYKRNSFPAKIE
jgi:hypothetical protein